MPVLKSLSFTTLPKSGNDPVQARRVFFFFAHSPCGGIGLAAGVPAIGFARWTMLWCGLATLSPFQPILSGAGADVRALFPSGISTGVGTFLAGLDCEIGGTWL